MCVSDRIGDKPDVGTGGAIAVRDVYQAINMTLDTHIGLNGDDCIDWDAEIARGDPTMIIVTCK